MAAIARLEGLQKSRILQSLPCKQTLHDSRSAGDSRFSVPLETKGEDMAVGA